MKNIGMALTLLLMFALVGCTDEVVLEHPLQEDAVLGEGDIPVTLSLSGDITAVDSPLTRADAVSGNDLIGIQVYQDGAFFAVGLFDNTIPIKINLFSGSKYKFECTVIKCGCEIVKRDLKTFYDKSVAETYGYGFPYNSKSLEGEDAGALHSHSYLKNTFIKEQKERFSSLKESKVSVETWRNYNEWRSGFWTTIVKDGKYCAELDRFYGELDNYIPSANGVVDLKLKRVSFGIKLKLEDFDDGTVSVVCKNDYNTYLDVSDVSGNYESSTRVFSLRNVYDAWQYADDGYAENATMTVTWTPSFGATRTWDKTVQLKRNAVNTIRITQEGY